MLLSWDQIYKKKNIFPVIIFHKIMRFEIFLFADLGQLTRDVFRANNA